MITPILKWPGGKRWLISSGQLPKISQYTKYIEPFLGGAAIFFYLKPENAILTDVNKELIETYQAIVEDYVSLEALLRDHHRNHCTDYYYKMRQFSPKDRISIAARFIYLNRTCWNGLYRVNKKGQFNVPIGTRTSILRDTDNFELLSVILKSAKIYYSDFEQTIDLSDEGDLLFVDPPYTVKHNHNNFLKYNENIFSWQDQNRLKTCLLRAKNRGVQIIMTNADHECIRELYKEIGNCFIVTRMSSLSSKSDNRKSITESVFTANFKLN
ncbi:Dam family site-specific DNA-(adenine-N6)-methyltransferase [Candidatus Roizmanbacteria bacterium]|nr:Dam family site-specific DNA-(adenine-N6)-methyltransferase [Candidatus Roizmanbacteria bacterium]